MKNKKPVLYILLTALGLILFYNYMIVPVLMRYNTRMGMHSRMYASTQYFVDMRFILLIAVVMCVFLLFEFLQPQIKSNRCTKCGNEIESDSWKICPICGNSLCHRKG